MAEKSLKQLRFRESQLKKRQATLRGELDQVKAELMEVNKAIKAVPRSKITAAASGRVRVTRNKVGASATKRTRRDEAE